MTKPYGIKERATHSVYWVNLKFEPSSSINTSLYTYLCIAHTDRIFIEMFQNNGSKKGISNVTFYACKMIKVTSGFNLKKTIFFTRRRHHPKNSWNIFQIQITPLLWRPQGPQGCLEKWKYPLSSNLVVWCAKIGPKT